MTTLGELVSKARAIIEDDSIKSSAAPNLVPARLIGEGDTIIIHALGAYRRRVISVRALARNKLEIEYSDHRAGPHLCVLHKNEQVDLLNRRITKEEPMHFSKTTITDSAKQKLTKLEDPLEAVFDMVARHAACDWGDVSSQVEDMNREELSGPPKEVPMPVLGRYNIDGCEFFIAAFYAGGVLQKRLLALHDDPVIASVG